MANVAVHESHLKYGGVCYYRGHAEEVELGSIGEKRTPITKQNYLEVKDRLPVANLKGVKSTIVEIDTSSLSQQDFGTRISAIIPVSGVPVPVKLGVDAAFSQLKSSELKLVKFSLETGDIVRAINDSPAKRQLLIDWGNDARVAHKLFLVMAAKTAQAFDKNVGVDLSVGVDGVFSASVGGGSSSTGKTTVKYAKDSTFAYLLCSIDWDAKQKKNINKAIDADDDQWGMS
jgi:hypothetical protein